MRPDATQEARLSRSSQVFLGFITLLNVMNFVDRQLLASFANFIVPDLGLSNTQFGLLTGLVFLVFYSVMGIFMGTLADRLNRTRLIAAGLALWSALTAASGAARGFVSLALPRMFIGVGESIMTPTSMSLLADRFPASRLGFAAGFYYMGVPIGVGVSLLIVGYLGPAIGWRNCFYLLGAAGVALAGVTLLFDEPPRRHAVDIAPGTARPSFREIVATLIALLSRSPALLMTMGGGVAFHFLLGALGFEQLWFVEERGFERAEIARLTGWIGLCSGVLGSLFGGVGGDWLLRRTGTTRSTFLFWVMLVMVPLNLVYRLVSPDSIWFWVGVFGGYFQLGAFYGPSFASVQELAPPRIRATVVAFYLLVLNLGGLGLGVTAAGIAVDALQARQVAEPYTLVLVAFTGIAAIGIPLFFFAGRGHARDLARLADDLAAE